MNLILASQSPRRKELLKLAGFTFEIKVTDADESINPSWNIIKVPEILARKKAALVVEKFGFGNESVVVAADTVVVFENKIFNKPANEIEAIQMLEMLNGKEHLVVTGICVKNGSKEEIFNDCTKVFFNKLTYEELEFYVKNYSPLDKAGAYGIQDWIGLRIVKKIEGCYFNVMGLPVSKLVFSLKKYGITGFTG